MHVYLNGQMVPEDKAMVSVHDAGFQHGVGLFETMGVYHAAAFRVQAHLKRLDRSARELGLTRQLDLQDLEEAVAKTIRHNGLTRARLRLTVTPGNTRPPVPGQQDSPAPTPTVLVDATEPTVYDPAYFQRGVTVLIASASANPFDPTSGHKTLAYWGRLRALRQAAAAGAGEAVWLDVNNYVASGSVSNVFLVKGGRLLTPLARGEEARGGIPAPVLPGITRAAIIELAEVENLPVQRQMLTINDLLDADEVFLTNSSWLVLPVTRVEKKSIGDGRVGPLTDRLRVALQGLIERETSLHESKAV